MFGKPPDLTSLDIIPMHDPIIRMENTHHYDKVNLKIAAFNDLGSLKISQSVREVLGSISGPVKSHTVANDSPPLPCFNVPVTRFN